MFRAADAGNRVVAIKVFRLDTTPERVRAFAAELERLVAAQLTHPAIAAPLAAGVDHGCAYLAEELVAADALDRAIRDHGPAPVPHAVNLAAQLAGALDFAAVVNVQHGSLHPRDVLVSPDESRVTGLGIAQALATIDLPSPIRRPYTAPERSETAPWDRRADIFSLAAIVFELIWGRRLNGLGEAAASSLTPIEGIDLAAARDVFARALTISPADRFRTALEFVQGLKSATVAQAQPAAAVAAPLGVIPELPVVSGPVVDVTPDDMRPPVEPLAPPRKLRLTDLGPGDPPLNIDASSAPDIDRFAPEPLPPGDVKPVVKRRATGPVAAALVVGVIAGLGGGYVLWRRATAQPVASAPAAATVSPASSNNGAREFTESAVPVPSAAESKPAAAAAKSIAPPPAPARAAAASVSDGRLLVRSTPAGARVIVDGRERGRTPLALRELSRGTHHVRLERDGYAPEDRRVALSAQRLSASLIVALTRAERAAPPAPPERRAAFAGTLLVESLPAGAKVTLDGKAAGTTPLTLGSVSAGSHVLRLEHEGYRRWSSAVRIVAGERNRVTASLEKQ